MTKTINPNKPLVYAVYTDSIEEYEVIMETEQSYFVRKHLISKRYYESVLDRNAKWVFTDYNQALEFLNTNRNENKN